MTSHGDEEQEYSYEVLANEEDVRICARITAESFAESNAFTQFHGFTADYFYENASIPLINEVLEERLSMLARHRSTGEIVGCGIAGDLYLNRQHYKPDTGWFAIGDFLNDLDEMFIRCNLGSNGEQLEENMVLHISIGATKVGHTGKGVMGQLAHRICENARKTRGFRYAYTQITHPNTRHIAEKKIGAKVVSQIDPTTWLWRRGGDSCPYPYKEWTGGPIVNMRLTLTGDSEKQAE